MIAHDEDQILGGLARAHSSAPHRISRRAVCVKHADQVGRLSAARGRLARAKVKAPSPRGTPFGDPDGAQRAGAMLQAQRERPSVEERLR
jgi:hypothetical protein